MNGGNKDTESKDSKQGSNGSNKDTESKDSKMFHDEPLNSNLIRGGSRFWESTSKLAMRGRSLKITAAMKKRSGLRLKRWAQRSSSEKYGASTSENPPKKRKQSIAQKAHELQKSRDNLGITWKHGYRGQFYISRGSPITCFELSLRATVSLWERKNTRQLFMCFRTANLEMLQEIRGKSGKKSEEGISRHQVAEARRSQGCCL